MLRFKQLEYPSRSGFTIIETIISIGFLGVIILMLFSILKMSESSAEKIQRVDDFLLNGRYAAEYIIEDVMLADEIVSVEEYLPRNIHYETLGFILINYNNGVDVEKKDVDKYYKYKYIYYRLTGNTILRSTYSYNGYRPNYAPYNGGHNNLVKNVVSVGGSGYNSDNKLLYIDIVTKDPENGKEYKFMETKYLGNY